MARLFLLILVAVYAAGVQCSGPDDSHYVAAVVDYQAPIRVNASIEEIMLSNIDTIEGFMKDANAKGADIIVFPEDGLQGFGNQPFPMAVPSPDEGITPCKVTDGALSEPLIRLSCLAAKYKIYLVVNLVHGVPCQSSDVKCPERGSYNYNTNVVFDRTGMIVARYHKYNLFGEYSNNVPPTVEYSIFDSDFGVRFGMFICFDILFDRPSAQLVRKHNITDIIYSAAWFSETPFLSAVQAHSGWAHALDVTLLASGMNYPPRGSTGSGIYRGQHGIINSTFNWKTESTMMVHRVPKRGHWDETEVPNNLEAFDPVFNYNSGRDPYKEVKQLFMIQDNLTVYSTELLKRPEQGVRVQYTTTLSQNDLRCNFKIEAVGVKLFQASSAAVSLHSSPRERPTFNKAEAEEGFDGFHYRAVAFNGVRDHSRVASTGVQICGLIACLNEELQSCGLIAPNLGSPATKWTEFTKVEITADFEEQGTLQFPSTQAGPRYSPMPSSFYQYRSFPNRETGKQTASLSLSGPLLDLRTFAIYGRNFARDGETPTGYLELSNDLPR